MKRISRALIVCPVSVMQNWNRELNDHWRPHVKNSSVDILASDLSMKKRERLLRYEQQ